MKLRGVGWEREVEIGRWLSGKAGPELGQNRGTSSSPGKEAAVLAVSGSW